MNFPCELHSRYCRIKKHACVRPVLCLRVQLIGAALALVSNVQVLCMISQVRCALDTHVRTPPLRLPFHVPIIFCLIVDILGKSPRGDFREFFSSSQSFLGLVVDMFLRSTDPKLISYRRNLMSARRVPSYSHLAIMAGLA